jgi:hypothetical protein
VKVTYKGGIDEVVVLFPSGDRRVVARGASIEILPTDAATLSPDDWDGVTPTPTPTPEEE